MSKGPQRKDALTVALRFISRRPRSIKEVRERLKENGFDEVELESAVTRLIEAGCLNDEQYAVLLAGSRIKNKNWGPRKIVLELSQKGVALETIEKVAGFGDEAGTARKALNKWARSCGADAPLGKKEAARAYRHLKGRGFSESVIFEALKALGVEENRH